MPSETRLRPLLVLLPPPPRRRRPRPSPPIHTGTMYHVPDQTRPNAVSVLYFTRPNAVSLLYF